MTEIWRSIKGYEGLYEVSNLGGVRNCRTGRVLRLWKDKYGYLLVGLNKDGVRKHCLVHRLVAQAFPEMIGWTEKTKGKPFDELQINHKDENPTNNRVENLEWCDCPYNVRYSQAKTVYMYTLDDKLCGLWPSVNECMRQTGWNRSHISECCNSQQKKYKGFKWSYEPPIPPKALPYFEALPRS